MVKKIHYHHSGFTLVELAIALMVIGLLIGGVLKGQELIENAKITSVIRQIKAYDAAAMIFRNTYGALPGDIKKPNRIPNCTDEICNIGGNGDGKITSYNFLTEETFNFFPHLTKAGMIQGPEGGTAIPAHNQNTDLFFPDTPIDIPISVEYMDDLSGYPATNPTNTYQIPAQHSIIETGTTDATLLSRHARIDEKIDDGKPRTGDVFVREMLECAVDWTNNEYDFDPDRLHEGCPLIIRTGF